MPHFVCNYMSQWLPQDPLKPRVHLLRNRKQKTKPLCLESFQKLVVWERFYLSSEYNTKIRWLKRFYFCGLWTIYMDICKCQSHGSCGHNELFVLTHMLTPFVLCTCFFSSSSLLQSFDFVLMCGRLLNCNHLERASGLARVLRLNPQFKFLTLDLD